MGSSQRNENSVLFSLTHLKDMAAASATSVPSVVTRPEVEMPFIAPVAMPMMLAPQRTRMPRWVLPVVVGIGGLFLIVIVLAIALVTRAPEPAAPVASAAPPAVEQPVKAPEPPAAAPAALPTATETKATSEESTASKDVEKKKEKKVAKSKRRRGGKARLARRGKRGKPVAAIAAAPKPGKKAAKPRKRDDLDDLIDSAMKK